MNITLKYYDLLTTLLDPLCACMLIRSHLSGRWFELSDILLYNCQCLLWVPAPSKVWLSAAILPSSESSSGCGFRIKLVFHDLRTNIEHNPPSFEFGLERARRWRLLHFNDHLFLERFLKISVCLNRLRPLYFDPKCGINIDISLQMYIV